MVVNVSKLQQIMSFVVLAAVIVAGVKCSNHEAEERATHDNSMRIKAQSRISMTKAGSGYGARVQIHEDLHGRKLTHAMAICDCNGQGPWRPLFKPSQILKTEFPEHEEFHEDVDTQYRNMMSDHVDNHLGSSPTAEHGSSGSDSGDGGSFGGINAGFGGTGGEVGALGKKHNHMIHLHLIPHIYVPVVHSAGYSEAKNYHTTIEGGSSTAPAQSPDDLLSEFHAGGESGSAQGPSSSAENPSSTAAIHDHSNFNGHSGESPFFTLSEESVHQQHQNMHENFGNAIDSVHHDYEAPANSGSDEPHQYQVHEYDDLSKDYSSKKPVSSPSVKSNAVSASSQQQQTHPQPYKYRKSAAATRSNRAKHGRMLSSRQDLKNLLVMRPPPIGQSQTWRYVYHAPAAMARHQFYQRKPPLMPLLKTRTVPLILHIRQRSDK